MVVQHNMQAMNANRMLNVTTSTQAKATEKLSSGYKINRAADDAAGLTISEKMRKQIKGLDRASTNAEDGVSSVQTAEGALTEVHSMLQRMNELAVQASNGTNSESDRSAIQDEVNQLTTEIDRVSETTKFNETYLLKGQDGKKTINMNTHDAGLAGKLVDNGDGTAAFTMDSLKAGDKVSIGGKNYTIGGTGTDVTALIDAANAALKKNNTDKFSLKIGDNEFQVVKDGKILDKDGNQLYVASAANAATPATFDAKTSTFTTTASFTSTAANTPKIDNAALTVDNLKAIASLSGKTTTVGADTVTVMTDAKNADGTQGTDGIDDTDASIITKENAYKLAANELAAANKIGDTEGASSVTNNNDGTFSIKVGQAKVANALSFSLHVGADADMTNKIEVDIESMDSASLGIKGLNVKDKTGNAATYAIDAIADAVAKVSSQRSALGAVQNRLEHTIANVDNVVENTTSAESRIRDTDMAEEMVNYSKNNILAQAGQSMLAQANQSNQGVLSLLQ